MPKLFLYYDEWMVVKPLYEDELRVLIQESYERSVELTHKYTKGSKESSLAYDKKCMEEAIHFVDTAEPGDMYPTFPAKKNRNDWHVIGHLMVRLQDAERKHECEWTHTIEIPGVSPSTIGCDNWTTANLLVDGKMVSRCDKHLKDD